MKTSAKTGECLQCGDVTNIQLDNGKYACKNCLNIIGQQTKNIRDYIENKNNISCKDLIDLLELLKNNDITSIDNAIKTFEAIDICQKYQLGLLNEEKTKKIKKQLDIINFL